MPLNEPPIYSPLSSIIGDLQWLLAVYAEEPTATSGHAFERGLSVNKATIRKSQEALQRLIAINATHPTPESDKRCKHGVWAADHCSDCERNPIKDERYKRGFDDGYDAGCAETVAACTKAAQDATGPVIAKRIYLRKLK